MAGCTECEFATLESTIESFSTGGIAGEVASYIQTHPEVNYIYFAFGQMAAGFPRGAGLGRDR